MKRLRTVSLLLLVLSLLGSFGCESWLNPKEAGVKEQGLTSEEFFKEQMRKPLVMAGTPPRDTSVTMDTSIPTRTPATMGAPTTIGTSDFMDTSMTMGTSGMMDMDRIPPAAVRTDMVSVSESASSVVSRTYPWPECGIVKLDKTMPKEVGLNRAFSYTISITNLTDTSLTGIIITEDLPGNFKFISANPTARDDQGRLLWEIPTLGPKAIRQMTVSGMATYTEPLKYCTTVVTPVIPACASVEVIQPELKLTKTAPGEVMLCDPIPVRYTVTNAGTGSVQNVRVVDTLAAGLRTVDGKSELIFDAGTLMAHESRQFSAELRATKPGQYISKAVASSTTGLRAESSATTTTAGMPVLAIQKTGPERQYIGRPVSYEITVANRSNVAAKNTVLEDTIPDGVSSVKASAGAKLAGSKLVWELGTLEPNASVNVKVSYTPTTAGTVTNTATATAYCTEAVNSSVRTTVTGIPALLLEVVDVEDPVRVGTRATYLIRVENQGSATATNIQIACMMEDNVRYISSAGATASSAEGQTIRFFPLANLAPKATATWRIVVEAVRPGDVRFKAVMNVDQLSRPVEETESTFIYE
ncbi:MAG: hypothetical protein ABIF19_17650 [Planctomycetota bacterium]